MSLKRVLIVGVGSIGERHLRCFQNTGRVQVAFVEPRAELREQIAARYPGTVPYNTFETALQTPQDVAVIATPAPYHIPQARQAVAQGWDVLIEKPLSVELTGIDELIAETEQQRRIVGVAYVHRANPLLQKARQVLQSGELGQPVELLVVGGQHFPTYRPAYREIYYRDHALGGGAIQDAITHLFNAGEWLLGPITKLVCDAEHLVLEGVDVEDTVHLLARQGEVLASYSMNQHQAPNELMLTVICQRGTLKIEWHTNRLSLMTTPSSEWQHSILPPLERDDLFIAQANTFLDAVETRQPAACTLEEGLQTLKVNQAALRSVKEGCWMTIC